jgi:hypothetical protein
MATAVCRAGICFFLLKVQDPRSCDLEEKEPVDRGRCPATKCSRRALITGACAHNVEENCTCLRGQGMHSSESLKRISTSPNSLEVGRC